MIVFWEVVNEAVSFACPMVFFRITASNVLYYRHTNQFTLKHNFTKATKLKLIA